MGIVFPALSGAVAFRSRSENCMVSPCGSWNPAKSLRFFLRHFPAMIRMTISAISTNAPPPIYTHIAGRPKIVGTGGGVGSAGTGVAVASGAGVGVGAGVALGAGVSCAAVSVPVAML